MTPPDLNSWLSPKVIATIGIPTCFAIYLLAVLTGAMPTPLMEGIRLMPMVYAQHTVMTEKIGDLTTLFKGVLALEKAHCDNDADTQEELQRCATAYSIVLSTSSK